MEHIEQAGVHSGDSACSLPPYSLSQETIDELKRQTSLMAKGLNVVGLMNVQFAIQQRKSTARNADTVYRAGSEPARLAHRAVRVQGDRPAAGQDRGALHGRPDPGAAGRHEGSDPAVLQRQGSRVPVREIPGRRHHPRDRR
jgi:hypothetical protein